ncbi:WxL domain-containing protein [Lactiplantibacillus daoliensis]|uniref:WxL domain-containing protein n=1 Tax=Lactiplantibacillus daoliensis TaxID=2559916 RepID=A0ABW1UCV9_9LACO|nr:WxL domain-containing protein [Lactiplantibacillus daoliensis]
MKKLMTGLVLFSMTLLVAPVSVKAADTGTGEPELATGSTNATIEFKARETTNLIPVNPNNPNEIAKDPELGNGDITNVPAGASFVYVTKNMTFGTTAQTIDMIKPVSVAANVMLNEPKDKQAKAVSDDWKNNFIVEIADGRGIDAKWHLNLSASPLTSGKDNVTGAQISWPGSTIHQSGEQATTSRVDGETKAIDLNDQQQEILKAEGSKAAGYTTAQFDPSQITLKVPANSTKPGTYTTTLKWTLSDVATS